MSGFLTHEIRPGMAFAMIGHEPFIEFIVSVRHVDEDDVELGVLSTENDNSTLQHATYSKHRVIYRVRDWTRIA